eukprot:4230186-Pleurochrysis_carterae.AAC.1
MAATSARKCATSATSTSTTACAIAAARRDRRKRVSVLPRETDKGEDIGGVIERGAREGGGFQAQAVGRESSAQALVSVCTCVWMCGCVRARVHTCVRACCEYQCARAHVRALECMSVLLS